VSDADTPPEFLAATLLVERYIADHPGCSKTDMERHTGLSEGSVTRALLELRAERRIYCKSHGWRISQQAMLVPEKGLRNTRRNRQWLRLCEVLASYCTSRESTEEAAWLALGAVVETR
jgi:hypothetical protein